jgi:hypothetical protein
MVRRRRRRLDRLHVVLWPPLLLFERFEFCPGLRQNIGGLDGRLAHYASSWPSHATIVSGLMLVQLMMYITRQ